MGALDISDQSPFAAIGAALVRNVEAAVPKLRAMSESRAEQPRAPGKWSPKQVIGHLIDSASNNHQRFVRGQEGESYHAWLRAGSLGRLYRVSALAGSDRAWHAYNRHLAHVIERIPEAMGGTTARWAPTSRITLAFIAEDYVATCVTIWRR